MLTEGARASPRTPRTPWGPATGGGPATRCGLAWAVVASVIAVSGTSAQTPTGIEVLELAASRHERIDALCADFEQRLDIALLGEEHAGKGRLCHRRPFYFGMRFTEPAGDLVIADGTWVWLYNPSMEEGQAIRYPAASSGGSHNIFHDFLDDPAARYTASYLGEEEFEGAGAAHRVRVKPRETAGFAAAELWIDLDEHILRKIRVEDENGTVRVVTLSAIDLAPALAPAWFEFVPPPGTTVITR